MRERHWIFRRRTWWPADRDAQVIVAVGVLGVVAAFLLRLLG